MTAGEHDRQRDRVRASLIREGADATERHNSYPIERRHKNVPGSPQRRHDDVPGAPVARAVANMALAVAPVECPACHGPSLMFGVPCETCRAASVSGNHDHQGIVPGAAAAPAPTDGEGE